MLRSRFFFCLPTGRDDQSGGQGESSHGRNAQHYAGMPPPIASSGTPDPSAAVVAAAARSPSNEASDPSFQPAPTPHRFARCRPNSSPTITDRHCRRARLQSQDPSSVAVTGKGECPTLA